jgi:hypothetical protein
MLRTIIKIAWFVGFNLNAYTKITCRLPTNPTTIRQDRITTAGIKLSEFISSAILFYLKFSNS